MVVHALQDLGYKVIVNVRWADQRSFEFCFTGIEKHSIVAVGTYGCSKEIADRQLFDIGLVEMIKRIEPKTIIFYGTITNSVKCILKENNQDYIVFKADTAIAMENKRHGNESK